jgi:hypothetical protein
MLAHQPPLPLDIDYYDISHDPTAEDEEGINFASNSAIASIVSAL